MDMITSFLTDNYEDFVQEIVECFEDHEDSSSSWEDLDDLSDSFEEEEEEERQRQLQMEAELKKRRENEGVDESDFERNDTKKDKDDKKNNVEEKGEKKEIEETKPERKQVHRRESSDEYYTKPKISGIEILQITGCPTIENDKYGLPQLHHLETQDIINKYSEKHKDETVENKPIVYEDNSNSDSAEEDMKKSRKSGLAKSKAYGDMKKSKMNKSTQLKKTSMKKSNTKKSESKLKESQTQILLKSNKSYESLDDSNESKEKPKKSAFNKVNENYSKGEKINTSQSRKSPIKIEVLGEKPRTPERTNEMIVDISGASQGSVNSQKNLVDHSNPKDTN